MLPYNHQIATRDQRKGGDTMEADKNSLLDTVEAEKANFEVKYIKVSYTLVKKPVEPKPASSREQNKKAGK